MIGAEFALHGKRFKVVKAGNYCVTAIEAGNGRAHVIRMRTIINEAILL